MDAGAPHGLGEHPHTIGTAWGAYTCAWAGAESCMHRQYSTVTQEADETRPPLDGRWPSTHYLWS